MRAEGYFKRRNGKGWNGERRTRNEERRTGNGESLKWRGKSLNCFWVKSLGFFSFFSHRLKQERFNDTEGNTVTSSYDFTGNQAQENTSVPCKPVNNILFLKVHKTGSSTVTNIFNRYGDKRDLIFALPTEDSFHWPLRFEASYATTFGGAPHILCNHARYNRAPMHFLFPKETTRYITMLRDPPTQLESVFNYYDIYIERLFSHKVPQWHHWRAFSKISLLIGLVEY